MAKAAFNRGPTISVTSLNQVAQAAQRTFVAGQGIKIDQTPDTVLIHAIANQREDIRYGRIEGCSVGDGGEGFPDDVTYSYTIDGIEGEVTHDKIFKICNRPAYGSVRKIVAQRYGTDVLVWMRRDEEGGPKKIVILMLTEEVKTRVCTTPAGARAAARRAT